MNGNLQPLRKRIYNRSTNTMQSTWYLVSPTTEFTTGMKDRKYDLNRRQTCFVIDTCLLYTSDAADD